MLEPFQNASDDFQKTGKDNYDAMLRSYGELSKGVQAISARMTEYSKQAFEDATSTFQKLAGVKSLEQAVEIQSQYVKTAFDKWVTEASKLSEMYAHMARDAYRPVEKAVAKKLT
jgi:phasin family protein